MKGCGSEPTDHAPLPTLLLCVHISVKPSEAPTELVIPLIKNGHRRQPTTQAPGPSTLPEVLADGMLSQAVKEIIEGERFRLCLLLLKEEGEGNGRIGWDLIAPSHSSSESKKSLEERENAGVDPTLAIPMIQKGCTPAHPGQGADSEPRAETVSWPLDSLLPQSLIALSARLASLPPAGKVCVCVQEACLSLPPSILFGSINR